MVERLRRSQAYVPELALVAHIGDQLAGHIMLTRIKIRHEQDHSESLSLAPLSVGPAFQRKGVGRALIEGAHQRARALHFASVIIVGISGYYDRFGYRPLNAYPIHLPFEVHPDNCVAIALLPSGLEGVKGTVEYAPEWMET